MQPLYVIDADTLGQFDPANVLAHVHASARGVIRLELEAGLRGNPTPDLKEHLEQRAAGAALEVKQAVMLGAFLGEPLVLRRLGLASRAVLRCEEFFRSLARRIGRWIYG